MTDDRSGLPPWGSVDPDTYAVAAAVHNGVDPADIPRVAFMHWATARWLRDEGPWPNDGSYDRFLAGDPLWTPREGPPSTIGYRTAADLRYGTPPDQLADPFATPEGPTILYARGGTGKGLMACWLSLRLVRSGHAVMVIDFEGHEREWGSRLRGLGLDDDELRKVHYRAPFAADWTAPTGALSLVADLIREDAERVGATYIVVDSYSVATSNGDTMGGEAAAREYFSALSKIGLPSLTIAHVRGDASKFPERPFGSVFVHNLARETWAAERLGDDGTRFRGLGLRPDHRPARAPQPQGQRPARRAGPVRHLRVLLGRNDRRDP